MRMDSRSRKYSPWYNSSRIRVQHFWFPNKGM